MFENNSYSLLDDLEAKLYRYAPRDGEIRYDPVNTLAEATTVCFVCPLCLHSQKGSRPGCHSVMCHLEDRVPDDLVPLPGRWKATGRDLHDVSFVPGKRSNSVALMSGCMWHGFVTNGRATLS